MKCGQNHYYPLMRTKEISNNFG